MKIVLTDTSYRYGFHVKKYPTIYQTYFKNIMGREDCISAIQIYIASPKTKAPPKFSYEDLAISRKFIENHKEIYVVVHGCLFYNLAGTVAGKSDRNYEQILSSTLYSLTAELDFAVAMGRPGGIGVGIVVHPGSRKNREEGHLEVAKSIEYVLTKKTPEITKIAKDLSISEEEGVSRRKIILENCAGEGTKLCGTLREIAFVIENVPEKLRKQVKVCIDTAHSFGYGDYDWGKIEEIDRFYEEFDSLIGIDSLELFHLNDSKISDDKRLNAPFGSKKDRHEHIGFGYIFGTDERKKALKHFFLEARKRKIPIIGEYPDDGYPELIDWNVACDILENSKFPLEKKIMYSNASP